MPSDGHLLLGSVGTAEYRPTPYEFDGATVESDVAPAALVELFDEDPTPDIDIGAALIARTPAAGDANDHRLEGAFTDAGIDHELVDIDPIDDAADIDAVVGAIVGTLRGDRFEETSVVLDISHSPRPLPMVFLLAVMHLEALGDGFTLERIYDSRFAGDPARDAAVVVDFTYLRTLIEWYDAFETARRTGTFRGLRLLLEEKRTELFVDGDADRPDREAFSDFVGSFGATQRELDAGFPLEAGIRARHALEALSGLDPASFVGPEGIVLEPLEVLLEGFETDQSVARKSEYDLEESELRRQASIVRYYTEHERYWVALECGRELFINRLLYDAEAADWLDRERRASRTPAAGSHTEAYTHDDPDVQRLWNRLSVARNQYAHAGFKEAGRPSEETIARTLRTLCAEIDNDDFWRADG